MRHGRLFAAAAVAAFLAAGQSQAQVTVLWPMAPPADREQVLATVTEDPAAQPQVLRYLLDFDLCTLSASDGSHFIAIDDSYVVFTSMQRLRQVYGADAMPNCSTGSTLLRGVGRHGVIYDPTGPHSVTWSASEVRHMLEAGSDVGGDVVEFGTPILFPADLNLRFGQALRALPAVGSAWLALAYRPGRGTTDWHLEVKADASLDRAALDDLVESVVRATGVRGLKVSVDVVEAATEPMPGVQVYAR